MSRTGGAVVIVSGGGAISPFTTPSEVCEVGQPAGSTDSALRAALLDAGLRVFTSPAAIGSTPVTNDPGFAGFDRPPAQPPADLTVNSVGDIDAAGRSLARFVMWLTERERLGTVDLVCHSMGGLFARAAIRELRLASSSPTIGRLVTVGTPWEGGFAADYASGAVGREVAAGDPLTEMILDEFLEFARQVSEGAGEQVTRQHLAGPGGWNEHQAGHLRNIDVTLVAGDFIRSESGAVSVFPHDGLVSVESALARGLGAEVVEPRERLVFGDVHSIFFAERLGLPWERGLTWDPEVHQAIVAALG